MLDNATSLSRSGLRDWLIQRVTAVVMAVYCVVLIAYVLSVDHLSYQFWHDLYHHTSIRVLSFLVVLSIVLHAWIGFWTVTTDYVKLFFLRLFLQMAVFLGLIALLAWGVVILWS
jgi:succinate dehydrogenase / fumarate reductase membrane anchor subunit